MDDVDGRIIISISALLVFQQITDIIIESTF